MKSLLIEYFIIILFLISVITLKNIITEKSIKKQTQSKVVQSKKVLIAKKEETPKVGNHYTNYVLAFNDGHTVYTDFGFYSCLEIGDTINFVKNRGESDFWLIMKPNCK